MIEIEGLSVEHGPAALHELSLRVAQGESVAVVGEDQPSLTLLIRCCGGLLDPTRGRISVDGVDVVTADRYALLDLHRTVGYVSIHGGLLANMSLLDNVELPLSYHGRDFARGGVPLDRATITARATALLEEAGLVAHAHARASTLPAEIQKCVAYLRAVINEPRVLLVEDPSALLHPRGRTIVRRIHERLRAQGVTVLMTDDDVEFAEQLTDRRVVVREGRIAAAELSLGEAVLAPPTPSSRPTAEVTP